VALLYLLLPVMLSPLLALVSHCTGVYKAMELKGHKSQVLAVTFSPDNKRCATASKDGTLRVWNIDVRYAQQEDPKTLLVVSKRPAGFVAAQLEKEPKDQAMPMNASCILQGMLRSFQNLRPARIAACAQKSNLSLLVGQAQRGCRTAS
jgi:hypothetical protein